MITYVTAITKNFGFLPNVLPYKNENRRFICAYDHPDTVVEGIGWEFVNIDIFFKNEYEKYGITNHGRFKHRYVKMHTHDLVGETDHICWFDAKFNFTSEVFFDYVDDLIKLNNSSFILQKHPIRQSYADEMVFNYTIGNLSYQECIQVSEKLKNKNFNFDDFFTILHTISIIKNNDLTKIVNDKWFKTLHEIYYGMHGNVRDQIIYPYTMIENNCLNEISLINYYEFGGYEEWKNSMGIYIPEYVNDFPKKVDWRKNISNFLIDIQNLTGSTIHSPEFGDPL